MGFDFAAEDGAEEADAVGFFEQGVKQADGDEGLAGALVHRGNVHAVGHLGLHPCGCVLWVTVAVGLPYVYF